MVLQTQWVTAEQFDEFIRRSDASASIYELISGEIVEGPTNPFASNIAAHILGFLLICLLKSYRWANGGFWVSGERYAPDVGYISKARQPVYKITNYLAAGTTVWLVYPFSQTIDVHTPGQPVQRVSIDGTLDGGDILSEFRLPLRDLFQPQ